MGSSNHNFFPRGITKSTHMKLSGDYATAIDSPCFCKGYLQFRILYLVIDSVQYSRHGCKDCWSASKIHSHDQLNIQNALVF